MRLFSGLLSLFAILTSVSAHAACGGGGYSVSRESKPAVIRREVRQEVRPQVRQEIRSEPVAYRSSSFQSHKFDSISSRLDLSERQHEKVFDAKRKVQERHDQLSRDAAKAQAKFESCQGRCDSEWRRFQDAQARLKQFNASAEFDQRLSGILNERQMSMYQSTSDRSTR